MQHVFLEHIKYLTCNMESTQVTDCLLFCGKRDSVLSKMTEPSLSMTLMDIVCWLLNIVGNSMMCYQQFPSTDPKHVTLWAAMKKVNCITE